MRPKNDLSHHQYTSQTDRFATAARALGADEAEAAFRAKLAVIGKQKVASPPKKTPRKDAQR